MQQLQIPKTSTSIIRINSVDFLEQDVDTEIVKDRNKDIKNLEQDLVDLSESMQLLATMVGEQGEAIDTAEEHVEKSVITINESLVIIENIPDQKETLVKNLKIAGSIVVGGTLCGGIGLLFGIGTAIIGTAVGCGGGAIVGVVSNLFKR